MSQSVIGERLDHLRRAGQSVLDGLTSPDRAALVTFSHMVLLRQGITSEMERLAAALAEAQPPGLAFGDTALIDSAYTAMMLGESEVGRQLMIVFSDGLDTSSWLTADAVLEAAKRSDVVVYAVSASVRGTPPFLRDLTSQTGGTVFEVDSTTDLSSKFVDILREFRQRYLVGYSPRGVSKEGWHRLEVRVKGRKATIKARLGYQAAP